MNVAALLESRSVEVDRLLRLLLLKAGMAERDGGAEVDRDGLTARLLGRVLHRRPTSHNVALSLQPKLAAAARRRQHLLSRLISRRSGASVSQPSAEGARALAKRQAARALRERRRSGLRRRFQSPSARRRRVLRAMSLRRGKGRGLVTSVAWLPSHSYTSRRFHMKTVSVPRMECGEGGVPLRRSVAMPSHCVMKQMTRVVRELNIGQRRVVCDLSGMGVASIVPVSNGSGEAQFTRVVRALEEQYGGAVVECTYAVKVIGGRWCLKTTQMRLGTLGVITVIGVEPVVTNSSSPSPPLWCVTLVAGPAGALAKVRGGAGSGGGLKGFKLHPASLWDPMSTEDARAIQAPCCVSVGWVWELGRADAVMGAEEDGPDTVTFQPMNGSCAGVLSLTAHDLPCWGVNGSSAASMTWRMCLAVLSPTPLVAGDDLTSPSAYFHEDPPNADATDSLLVQLHRAVFRQARGCFFTAARRGVVVGLLERQMLLACLGVPSEGDFAVLQRGRGPSVRNVSSIARQKQPDVLPTRKGRGGDAALSRPIPSSPTVATKPSPPRLLHLLSQGKARFVQIILDNADIPPPPTSNIAHGFRARRVLSAVRVGAAVRMHTIPQQPLLGVKRERVDDDEAQENASVDIPTQEAPLGMVTSLVYNRLAGGYTAMVVVPGSGVAIGTVVAVGGGSKVVGGRVVAVAD